MFSSSTLDCHNWFCAEPARRCRFDVECSQLAWRHDARCWPRWGGVRRHRVLVSSYRCSLCLWVFT